jgi:transposase
MEDGTATGTGHDAELSSNQLVELVRRLQKSVEELEQTVRGQQQIIEELRLEKDRLKQQLSDCDAQHPTQRLDDAYSLEAEDQRNGGKGRRKQKSPRRGRRTTEEKLAQAQRHENVYPEDVPPGDCTQHSSRVVWRVENGQAVLVAYHVYRGPDGDVPTIPGTLGRSEYGIEISVALAFMVFIVRLSMDKVCQQFEFFWGLKLAKSQADALRRRHWLLAVSAISRFVPV